MSDSMPAMDRVELGKYYELSTHLIALRLHERGFPIEWLNFTSFITTIAGQEVGFWVTRCSLSTTFAERACTRKDVTNHLLSRSGIPVARGRMFRTDEYDQAASYATELGVTVVKPVNGMKGKGLTLKVKTIDGFERAWQRAVAPRPPGVLVERWYRGKEARFLVVGEQCVAVSAKEPPHVVGDGVSTIQQLIDAKNSKRRESPHLRKRLIHMQGNRVQRVRHQGYELDSVPNRGDAVRLDDSGNISTGAESIDITDSIHPSYLDVAVRAARSMRGLAIAGVDMLIKDFSVPAEGRNHIVVEVNSHPGIGGHHYPVTGQPRDVAGAIADYCISQFSALVPSPRPARNG